MKKALIVLVSLLLVSAAGYGIFRFFDAVTPPNFARTGGTILVYEIDAAASAGPDWDPVRLRDAVQQRLDPDSRLGIRVAAGQERVEIRVPHRAGDIKPIEQVKDLLAQTGKLEFRMLANRRDDQDAVEIMTAWFDEMARLPEAERKARQDELDQRAKRGQPPPGPEFKGNRSFAWSTGHGNGWATYSWVELGKEARLSEGLTENADNPERWQQAAEARNQGKPLVFGFFQVLLYSRPCLDTNLPAEERKRKGQDFFYLVRDPEPAKLVSGRYLKEVRSGPDQQLRPAIHFVFDVQGGDLFYELTNANLPGDQDRFQRHLAIVLDDRIVTSPTINSAIRSEGQISAPNWSMSDVNTLIQILRAGALPVKLKTPPVARTVPPGAVE